MFPAISLVMLAHTNRFLALSSVIRHLHDKYQNQEHKHIIHGQIKSIRFRLKLVKRMQALGVLSFLSCIFSMYFIYIDYNTMAHISFAISLLLFILSLLFSFWEIQLSTKALELSLGDMEGLENPSMMEFIKKKFE